MHSFLSILFQNSKKIGNLALEIFNLLINLET